MRLWHQYLIKYLPDKHLLGQHRELCALRGLGFGRKHSVVDYVFKHPYSNLYWFHMLVIKEMEKRNFNVDAKWKDIHYRGKKLEYDYSNFTENKKHNKLIYSEHNDKYLIECLTNLHTKHVIIYLKDNKYIKDILFKESKILFNYYYQND